MYSTKKDNRDAPTKDPMAGKAAIAPLVNTDGAGASDAVLTAVAVHMEAAVAAKTARHAIFFMSIFTGGGCRPMLERNLKRKPSKYLYMLLGVNEISWGFDGFL